MKSYILSVVAIVIISTILLTILPKGRTNNIIKCVISVCILFVIIKPIFYFDFNDLTFDNASIEFKSDDSFLKYIYENKNKENVELVNLILERNNLSGRSDIDYIINNDSKYEIKNINLFLNIDEFTNKNEHTINIEKCKIDISNCLSIDIGLIIVNE